MSNENENQKSFLKCGFHTKTTNKWTGEWFKSGDLNQCDWKLNARTALV